MTESEVSSPALLIKGGLVVNDDRSFEADVLLENGKIKKIGPNLAFADVRVINAKGLIVMPGGIDSRTRFKWPFSGTFSADDFYHGTRSAVAGGTTMIIDSVVSRKEESLVEAFNKRHDLADAEVCCDYGLHVALPAWNDKVAQEMATLTQEKGVNSFTISLADQLDFDDDVIYKCLNRCRELGALLQVHAENGHFIKQKEKEIVSEGILGPEGHLLSRPDECESEAVYRTVALAKEAGAPVYVMKVTSRSAADIIAKSRKNGNVVFGECTAAALGTNGFHVFNTCWRHAASHVTSPPLRSDLQAAGHLMDLLANGDFQTTSSDNCTYNVDQKAMGKDDFRKIPSGVNGVEDRMSVVWEKGISSGKMDLCRFVAITSTCAAKIFNIYPQKGRIAVGSDADIVIWDPNATRTISAKTHRQNCDFNVFEGLVCHGAPAVVISRGRIVMDSDGLHVAKGSGRFVEMAANGQYVYGRIREREKKRKELAPVDRDPYEGPTFDKTKICPTDDLSNPITPDKTFHDRNTSANNNQGDGSQGEEGGVRSKRPAGYRVNQPPGGKTSQLW